MEWLGVLVSASVAFIVYVNTLSADFAYDDSRAILKNQDLLPDTPWSSLLFDDFWGTPLTHSGSHKSYRPLCVATFRLNYLIDGHAPVGYHLVNVLLHSLVSGLFAYVVQTTMYARHRQKPLVDTQATCDQDCNHGRDGVRRWTPPGGQVGIVAGLLFAVHPIHTEAVAGIVGRADILACLFFLLSFESYARYCRLRSWNEPTGNRKYRSFGVQAELECTPTAYNQSNGSGNHHNGVHRNGTTSKCHSAVPHPIPDIDWRHGCPRRRWLYVAGCVLFTAASMLSKEHGVTVLAVCLVYDTFVVCRLRFNDLLTVYKSQHRGLHEGFVVLFSTATVMICARLLFMGFRTPEFSPSDNPTSDSPLLATRVLTFFFLTAFNGWLLLCPSRLSFDWSMGSVPLIETVFDARNAATVTFYLGLVAFTWRAVRAINITSRSTSASVDVAAIADRSPSSSSSGSRRNSPTTRKPMTNGNGSHHLMRTPPLNGSVRSLVVPSPSSAIAGATSRLNGYSSSCVHRGTSVDDESSRTNVPGVCSHRSSSHYHLDRRKPTGVLVADDDDDDVTEWFTASPRVALVSLALIVVPFVPATNLFFYVGFVVAERVLYIPSLGLCVLVADGLYRLMSSSIDRTSGNCRWWRCLKSRHRRVVAHVTLIVLVVAFSAKTIQRNADWRTEESLYRSGINVNPAKAWGNLANVLNAQGKSQEAESAYKSALAYRSNMADVHYNLGILYQEQGRHAEAIQSYKLAIQCRPRLTLAYLNLGIVYATVGMKAEAENIYRTCSEIDISGLKDPRLHEQTKVSALYNLGRLLDDQGRHQDAVDVYLNAVNKLPSHYAPQSLYNMLGEAYSKLSDVASAEFWYRKALKVKPDHIPAHLTLAKLYQRQGWLDKAEQLFLKAQQIEPKDANVYQHYGQFLTDVGRHQDAVTSYLSAAQLAPSDFELIFNTASSLRQAGRNLEAENFYKKAVLLRPDMALAHMNLGAMLHFNGRLLEAETSYLTALRLQPNDDVTIANLNKLRNKLRAGNSGRV